MANDIFSNGCLHENTVVQRARNDRNKRAPDIAAIESRNWLLHRHYTRHEYSVCKVLIEKELTRSNGHEYANYLKNHREYDVALSKYKVAAQTIPESSILWNNIGMCLYAKQKYVAAISSLKRAHYLSPMSCIPSCNLGIVFLTTGQPASAAIYLCAAVSAGPKNPTPYLLLGLALKRLDDLEGAEKSLTKAHALSPQDPLILINYAVVLDARGKQVNATEILTALNDIMAVVEVDVQISQMAKKLSKRLQHEKMEFHIGQKVPTEKYEEQQLSADEV